MLILRNFPQYIIHTFFLILLFTVSFFYTYPAFSKNKKAYERVYIVKAGFIYNFTKFIKWPEDAFLHEMDGFLIGVMGSDPFGNILDTLAAKKKVEGRKLVIKRFSSLDEIETCHILFVSSSEKDHLEEILSKLNGPPVLFVGDTPGYAERGVGINFYIQGNKVWIEFNKEALERAGLKISSQLLNVGRIIK
ncbi:MAG: YfiR family protein [Thermodesulfobacteriota bacterium]